MNVNFEVTCLHCGAPKKFTKEMTEEEYKQYTSNMILTKNRDYIEEKCSVCPSRAIFIKKMNPEINKEG